MGIILLLRLLTYISFFFFASFFLSCEEEIIIQDIEVEKFVVVNSSFCPSKEFEVQLDFSGNILDNLDDITFIDDADIKIYNDNGDFLLDFIHIAEGMYQTPDHTHPLENQIYKVEIKVNGYPTIKASSRVPTKAIVENLNTAEIDKDGDKIVKIDFDIQDSEDIDNYYIWEIFNGDPEISSTNQSTSNQQEIQTVGPSESSLNNGSWSKLFIQEMDINQALSFSFPAASETGTTNTGNGGTTANTPESDMYLKVISASADYYEYLLSVQLHENSTNTNGDGAGSSTSLTPIELHTNIEGGLGIFAGFNEQFHKLPPQ